MDINSIIKKLRIHKESSGKTWKQISTDSGVGHSLLSKLVVSVDPNPTIDTANKLSSYVDSVSDQKAA